MVDKRLDELQRKATEGDYPAPGGPVHPVSPEWLERTKKYIAQRKQRRKEQAGGREDV